MDEDAWSELARLLPDGDRLPWTYEAYQWAFETAADMPGLRPPSTAKTMLDVVHDLDRRGVNAAMPLALPFIRFLAAQMTDIELAAELNTWVSSVARRLGVGPVPPASPQARRTTTVHIELTTARQEGQYRLRMWLHYEVFECIQESDQPVDLVAAQVQVGEQLVAIYDSGIDTTEMRRLEFHVPFELLDEPFEAWAAPLGVRGRNTALGEHFEVVVRCPDERSRLTRDHWHRKWSWFTANDGTAPEAVRILRDEDVLRGASRELLDDAPPICIFAAVSGEHLETVIDHMLEGGIPIAVWPRGGHTAPTPTEQCFDVRLREDSKSGAPFHIRDLPARLRTWRAQSHPPHLPPALVLLWDDPTRRPSSRIS
ncbi:VMAP-C domain-containing protein [Nocardia takedensis]|uniref:VMAP-C domain-containing protein n=1 Tax=Nocardia takedensis TaxID=259390 RepID=UPI0005927308|nr:hypothetical protein [Nocardia takedensis]